MTRSLTGIAWNKEKYQGTPLQLDDDRLGEGFEISNEKNEASVIVLQF